MLRKSGWLGLLCFALAIACGDGALEEGSGGQGGDATGGGGGEGGSGGDDGFVSLGADADACIQAASEFEPCGGDLLGTWLLTTECIVLMSDDAECPEGADMYRLYRYGDGMPVTFEEDNFFHVPGANVTIESRLRFPLICTLADSCEEQSSTPLFSNCSGEDICTCDHEEDFVQPLGSLPYSVEGNVLTCGGSSYPYCVQGDTLTLAIHEGPFRNVEGTFYAKLKRK